MKAWLATDGLAEAHPGTIKPRVARNFPAPIEVASRLKTLDTAALGYLQRTAGNASVSAMLARLPSRASAAVQRCGPKPCSCSPEEQAAHAAEEQGAGGAATVQRTLGDGHDLCAPRFAGDLDLEGCYDDEARLTMGGRGKAGTRKVDRGPAVAAVQQALADLGLLSSGSVTGQYNQATWDAVAHLKRKERLGWGSMGDVGPLTMDHLNKKFMPPCPRPSPPALRRSARRAPHWASPPRPAQRPVRPVRTRRRVDRTRPTGLFVRSTRR
jgi:Putative peptidoglycan binding domain